MIEVVEVHEIAKRENANPGYCLLLPGKSVQCTQRWRLLSRVGMALQAFGSVGNSDGVTELCRIDMAVLANQLRVGDMELVAEGNGLRRLSRNIKSLAQ